MEKVGNMEKYTENRKEKIPALEELWGESDRRIRR